MEVSLGRGALADATERGLVVDEEQEHAATEELLEHRESSPNGEGLVGQYLRASWSQGRGNLLRDVRLKPHLSAVNGENCTQPEEPSASV